MADKQRVGILMLPKEGWNESQPLTEDQREFVDSIYALFEQFKDRSHDYIEEIGLARKIRELRDELLDPITLPVPTSQLNTLNSTIDNMVADFMDNLPEAIVLPETSENGDIADQMTDVLGWILHHAGFNAEWLKGVEDATVVGTGILQVYYDDEMDLGVQKGGIGVKAWRPEAFFPDPLYEDLQDGRAVFKVSIHPISYFAQHFPEQVAYVKPDAENILDFEDFGAKRDIFGYDDPLVALLEVWYRRYDPEKKRYHVHMAKVAGNALLYDSTEDSNAGEDGVYAHGKYPFSVLRFRSRRGTPYGTGMVYEFADTQRMINRYTRYVDENIRAASRPKLLVSRSAGIDVSALANYEQQIVEAEKVDKEFATWFNVPSLNSLAPTMIATLKDTMKQDSGQNQFSRGEGGLGVTAASAIAQLQEAGGKLIRLHTGVYLNAFKEICDQIIALVGEFFEEPLLLTIHGQEQGLPPKQVQISGADVLGGKEAWERPAMFVRPDVQKSNPNQIQARNQLMIQMAQIAQSTNPIPPRLLIRAMHVSGKEDVIKVLDEADMQLQQLQQLQQMAEQLAAENEQLKQAFAQVTDDATAKTQVLQAVANQMRAGQGQQQPGMAEQSAPSMPTQPQQQVQNMDYSTLLQ